MKKANRFLSLNFLQGVKAVPPGAMIADPEMEVEAAMEAEAEIATEVDGTGTVVTEADQGMVTVIGAGETATIAETSGLPETKP